MGVVDACAVLWLVVGWVAVCLVFFDLLLADAKMSSMSPADVPNAVTGLGFRFLLLAVAPLAAFRLLANVPLDETVLGLDEEGEEAADCEFGCGLGRVGAVGDGCVDCVGFVAIAGLAEDVRLFPMLSACLADVYMFSSHTS